MDVTFVMLSECVLAAGAHKVDAHMAKLTQHDPSGAPQHPDDVSGSETHGFLRNVHPDEIAGAQSHTYEPTPSILRGWFGGDDHIRYLVLPGFFFHISIAHVILRHLGAKIGKRDYLCNPTQQSGGDYSCETGAGRGTDRALQGSKQV
ncbi:DUF1993 family protein [Bradyrhizobium elkanii]|uniref:DUF1993 family protein n=1 Tax=Bradyrhizobium elkanii TaxID=29448 RepID=UPI00041E9D89|nr:DUF1993 family protein [Bradyrhizobium elkanii]